MSVHCFWVEPTGDAEIVFKDGRVEVLPWQPADRDENVQWQERYAGWKSISPRYRRADTGEVRARISEFGPGAMWDATWYKGVVGGPFLGTHEDGRVLCVTLPNGLDWVIDHRASNCDSPCATCAVPYKDHAINDKAGHYYSDAHPHRCWVRHGEPPVVTVDKAGVTCGAGAGSILSGDYHGFLQNGKFVP